MGGELVMRGGSRSGTSMRTPEKICILAVAEALRGRLAPSVALQAGSRRGCRGLDTRVAVVLLAPSLTERVGRGEDPKGGQKSSTSWRAGTVTHTLCGRDIALASPWRRRTARPGRAPAPPIQPLRSIRVFFFPALWCRAVASARRPPHGGVTDRRTTPCPSGGSCWEARHALVATPRSPSWQRNSRGAANRVVMDVSGEGVACGTAQTRWHHQ